MARNITSIQVFVASPTDVQDERATLESLIGEMNQIWSGSLGIMFELVRWETHTHPAFGSDPQAIINEQIGEEYDVFVGIIWARFGTPTPRAASGTLEEFERALERRTNSGSAPEIMVYFKDAPISPSEVDAEQLGRVSCFKKSLSDRGGLYSVFKDASGFESSLRAHLSALAINFSTRIQQRKVERFGALPQETATPIPAEPSRANALSEIDHDLGFLDYIEIYQSRMAEMTSTIGNIGDATRKISRQLAQRTKEIAEISEVSLNLRDARKIVTLSADNMFVYAEVLQSSIPQMTSSRSIAFGALTNALALYGDFSRTDTTDLTDLRAQLSFLIQAASASIDGLRGYRASVNAMPRMTSELNRAKRAVVDQLDVINSEIDKTIHDAENIREAIDAML